MVEYALGSIPHDVNITHLSNTLGINTSTLWFKVAGNRRWDVETWLDLLCALGYLKAEKGKLVIKTHIPENQMERFRKLYKQYV